jgi:hypothetical protein
MIIGVFSGGYASLKTLGACLLLGKSPGRAGLIWPEWMAESLFWGLLVFGSDLDETNLRVK